VDTHVPPPETEILELPTNAVPPRPAFDPDTLDNVIDFESRKQEMLRARIKLTAKLERMVRQARESPLGLYRLCFRADDGDAITLKWFHKEWQDMVLQNRCVMIEAPRGSTKTTFVAVVLPLWFLGHNPELRIKLVCANDKDASKRLGEIRSHIEEDPLYKLAFPNVTINAKKTNNTNELNLVFKRHTKDSTIEAQGVLSNATGGRADIIIFDDSCSFKNSVHEPGTRPKVLQKMRGDWLNTLNPKDGRVWSIFTPWHVEDANAILKKETKGKWVYKRYFHGTTNNPYKSIFPELFSEQWLRDKHVEIGSLEFARAYWCKAMSGDVQIVRSEWLRTYGKYDITPEMLQRCSCILSIDPTGSKGSKSTNKDPDYIGVSVNLLDLAPDAAHRPKAPYRIFVTEAYQVRLSTAQATALIIYLANKWKPDAVVIEAQGAQSLHEWVYERAKHLFVVPMPANLSKEARLRSITPWLEDPRELVLFHPRVVQPAPPEFDIHVDMGPEGVHRATAKRDLRKQLIDFPTSHDDIMDSEVQNLRYLRQWMVPYEGETDDEERINPNTPEVELKVRMIG
jgi:hypothetical protein